MLLPNGGGASNGHFFSYKKGFDEEVGRHHHVWHFNIPGGTCSLSLGGWGGGGGGRIFLA